MERKLTAILCADVHGYSRLMGEDEEATIRNLSGHRRIIDGLIEQHHGRFVNSAGDSVLAEFASAVNAVECAVAIQAALKTENANVPLGRRMEFRIGVNLGDVVVEGEQIYGDGVNVAARLESLAEPGSIYISASIHEQIRNKLALRFEDLGPQHVKNIAEPVRVWRVVPDGGIPLRRAPRRIARSYWRGGVFSLAGLAIVAATIVLVQHLTLKPPRTTASIPPQAKPALPLPSIPSMAVLPFANLSDDPQQEYFSDGISDYLITNLSRIPGLFVIARNSSFIYKNKPVTAQEVGRTLGVRLVLEGSVVRGADRIQINIQLADAASGANLWAQTFNRPTQDIFALQQDVLRKIVMTLSLFLKMQDLKVPARAGGLEPTDNLEAFDNWLRGEEYLWRLTKAENEKARAFFKMAIALDPRYSDPYAQLALTYLQAVLFQWTRDPPGDLKRASEFAQKALALDDSNSRALAIVSWIDLFEGRLEQGVADGQRAVALNPNYANGYFALGNALILQGEPEEAIPAIEKAIRLDPESEALYAGGIGIANVFMERYQPAIPALEKHVAAHPQDTFARSILAIAYSEVGRAQGARAQTAEIIRLNPQYKLPPPETFFPKSPVLARRYLADLRKAGLK